jgi:hypothetical protein
MFAKRSCARRAVSASAYASALLLLVTSASAQTYLYTTTGNAQGDRLGESVASLGDFNGDGYGDFAAGAKFDDSNGDNAGLVRVISGRDGSILFSVNGSNAGDWLGVSVAGAGDVNGDGYMDLIVGASGYDAAGTNSGRAYVYSGRTGGTLYRFDGSAAFDHFGQAVGGAGDVNGDGYDDLVVGAPQEGNGTVHVYSGRNGAQIWAFAGSAAGDTLGGAVAGAGDVNGDGFADIIAGAPYGNDGATDNGYARVYSGRTGALLYNWHGGSADHFGSSVDGAGDFTGDGFDDVIVGSPNDEPNGADSGSAWIYSGFDGSLYLRIYGLHAGDLLGTSVAGCGVVEKNGKPAIIVGAPGEAGGTVRVYDRTHRIFQFAGVVEYSTSVDGGGDLNRDGLADLIIGDPARFGTGRAYSYLSISAWANRDVYGAGWPGTHGVPSFTASADPVLCSNIQLDLENSRGSTTPGVLMIGLAAASVPTALGGTLLVVPHTILPITIPGAGLSIPLSVECDSAFAGFAVYMQVLEFDPGASQDASFTAGLQLILGGLSPY